MIEWLFVVVEEGDCFLCEVIELWRLEVIFVLLEKEKIKKLEDLRKYSCCRDWKIDRFS